MTAIVFVATAWGPLHGGVNSFNQDLARAVAELAPSGIQVACAVPNPQQHQINAALRDRITLVTLGRSPKDFDPAECRSVVRQLGQEPDWWIGHDRISGPFATGAAAAVGSQSAVVVHTDYRAYASMRGIRGGRIVDYEDRAKATAQQATRVFGVGPRLVDAGHDLLVGTSPDVREIVPGLGRVGHFGVPKSFNAITFGRFKAPDDRLKQVRLVATGFGRFVRAARLRGQSPKLTFLGTGDDPNGLSDELQRLAAREAGGALSVTCTEFLDSRDKLHRRLQDSSVCLVLSAHEGFGLSAWEALSAGVPLVLAKDTGLHHLLKRVGGRALGCIQTVDVATSFDHPYFEEASVDAVVDALWEIHKDTAGAKRDAQQLLETLQEFTWEKAAANFLADLSLLEMTPAGGHSPSVAVPSVRQNDCDGVPASPPDRPSRIKNPPPAVVPSVLRDRRPEREQVVAHLREMRRHLLVLRGPMGSGKTALIAEVIKNLDNDGPFSSLDYLSAGGPYSVSGPRVAERLAVMAAFPVPVLSGREPEDCDWHEQVERVLRWLTEDALLVLDQVENLLDEDGRFRDRSLHALLMRLSESDDHKVHVLLVTAQQPHPDLFGGNVAGSAFVLDDPLPLIEARDLLRDFAGERPLPKALSLQEDRAIELAHRRPRELELFAALFSTDTRLLMSDVNHDLERMSLPNRRKWLVRRVWSKLNEAQQWVITALATLGFPATITDLRDVLRDGLVEGTAVNDAVEALVDIRFARRIAKNRFDVPPSDASLILACWGDDERADRLRAGLTARAADCCSKLAKSREARSVEDLGPHLREIELRLQLGDRVVALGRMYRLDKMHLRSWGYQHILGRWRLDLAEWQVGSHYWYANISALANGLLELDEVEEACDQLERALERLPPPPNEGSLDPGTEQAIDDRLALTTQLGRACWLAGRPDRAAERFAQERAEATAAARPYAAARACLGMAACRIDLGQLDEADDLLTDAEGELGAADRAVATAGDLKIKLLRAAQIDLLRANLSLSRATLAQLVGDYPRARTLADQAQTLAVDAGNSRLQIRVLDFNAGLILDEHQDGASAVELAEEASRLTSRTGVSDTARTAHATLAFAYLYQERVDDALSAAHAAARFFRSRRALIGAVALAVALLRAGRTQEALDASAEAARIVDQFRKNGRPYWVWDYLGAAEAVRWACRDEGARSRSMTAYDRARRLTMAAGARRRSSVILEAVFTTTSDDGSQEIRRAADRGVTNQADATGPGADGASSAG